MLRSLKKMKGSTVHASDGDIGRVDQFFFDDEHWVIRYIVVDTGGWLTGRKVLVSPVSVREVEWTNRRVHVNLTRDQVERSPDIDTTQTFSRRKEVEFYRYYRWPVYWGGAGLWGNGMYPAMLPDVMITDEEKREAKIEGGRAEDEDIHLRSSDEVTGYHLQARDGEIGHVEDFVIDDETWAVKSIVVDTRNWLPGKKVLLEPKQINRVNWYETKVHVDLPRDSIRQAPEADYEAFA